MKEINAHLEAYLMIEDHGLMTLSLAARVENKTYTFPVYQLDYHKDGKTWTGMPHAMPMIRALMNTVGVTNFASLDGELVRIRVDDHDHAVAIGHIIKDKWFSQEQIIEQYR